MTQQQTSRLGRLRLATRWGRRRATPGAGRHPSRFGWLAPAVLLAAALTAAACGSSGAGGSGSTPSPAAAPSSGSTLRTTTINGVTVLTTAKGFTLYSFAPDTPTTSKCNGSCAHFWPPVKGPVTAGPGITGKLGTIKRSDGSTQATYNSHPLYTYIGDTAPGQAHGNGLNLNGGLWHETTTSSLPAAQARQSAGLHAEQLFGAAISLRKGDHCLWRTP